MRYVFFLLSVLTAFCYCSVTHKLIKNNHSNEVKELLIGKWILTTDDEFIIDIKEDEITYYYNGKVDEINPIEFLFNDSLIYYKTKDDAFNFMKNGKLHSMVKIVEYTNQRKDTSVNTVIYIDKEGMDLLGRNRSVSFRKSK